MPEKFAEVICPKCHSKVLVYRTPHGRILVTTALGISLAAVGATIGASIGIATGGWAAPATIPLGAIGLVVGSGLGYLIGDKVDKLRCPSCHSPIDLGV